MRPNFVILYVKDPTASSAFYSRLLGAGPVESSPTFVMFALESGVMLGLWIRDEVQPAVTAPAGGAELAITVDSRAAVDAALREWRAAGTAITMEPTGLDFGYGFVGADPDGHRIRVFCPGEPR